MGKIVHIVISNRKYGGGVYGRYISKLKGVETIPLIIKSQHSRFAKFFEYYINLFRFSKQNSANTVIRNMDASFFMKRSQKNIVVFHHYHPMAKSKLLFWYQKFVYQNLLHQFGKIDTFIVVSRYWKEYFENLDLKIKSIKIIYNPFEIELYAQRDQKEMEEFRKRFNLSNKPIVYIGSPQEEKGVIETYDALKHLDIEMVASGISHIDLPVKQLDLSFYDYITLLQIASVSVLMSRFREGWNRVAHESLLSRTPVIGTGYGGMEELLQNTDQTICRDFSKLPEFVKQKLQDPTITEDVYDYVASFSVEKFNSAWEEVLNAKK